MLAPRIESSPNGIEAEVVGRVSERLCEHRDAIGETLSARRDESGRAPGIWLLDVLTAAQPAPSETSPPDRSTVGLLVERVRSGGYTIADLHEEFSAIKGAYVELLPSETLSSDSAAVLGDLDAIFAQCLSCTSLVHETVLETSKRGYCELDLDFRIRYANAAMHTMLGVTDCRGLNLPDLFGDLATFVREALTGVSAQRLRRMILEHAGRRFPVTGEFGQVRFQSQPIGAYAIITDVSDLVRGEQLAFEKSNMGVLKADNQRRITFINSAAADIFGASRQSLVGMSIHSIFPEEENRRILEAEIAQRDQGIGSEYELTFYRPADRRAIPLRVHAMPEFDSHGDKTGVFALVESLEVERAREQIAAICEHKEFSHELFSTALEVVRDLVPFDLATFSIYTKDMSFARPVHFSPRPDPMWETRWFPIPQDLQGWIQSGDTWSADLAVFLAQEPSRRDLSQDPTVKRLVDEGYHGFICVPLREADRVSAALSLVSFEHDRFSKADMDLLRELGVDRLMRTALLARERAETESMYRLLKSLASAGSTTEIGQRFVRSLALFYPWQNVALFKVNRVRHCAQLIAQAKGRHDGYLLPEGFEQSLDEGVLGRVYRTGEASNVPDVTRDPDYRKSTSITRSELCMPIRLLDEDLWLLNLEDRRLSAFAEPEIDIIGRIVKEVEGSLERLFLSTTLEQTFSIAKDAILILDVEGRIKRMNAAAEKLCEMDQEQARDRPLIEFLERPAARRAVLDDHIITDVHTKVRGAHGTKTPVILEGRILPEEYDQKVVFMRDVAPLRRFTEKVTVDAALDRLTSETRIPLSLALSQLRQAVETHSADWMHSACERSINHLSRLESIMTRVLPADLVTEAGDDELRSVAFGDLLEHALSALAITDSQRKEIQVEIEKGSSALECRPYQLSFALQSILGYLLHDKYSDDPIHVCYRGTGEGPRIVIEGADSDLRVEPGDYLGRARAKARRAVALAESTIKQIVHEEHGGTYRRSPRNGRTKFELRLPAKGIETSAPRRLSSQ